MGTNDTAKNLNDKRMHAHQEARMLLARAAVEGRPLRAEEKSAIARADQIISECQSVRDDLIRRDRAIAELDGVRDEFRARDAFPDLEGDEKLSKLTDRGLSNAVVEIDIASSARAFQAFRAGMRGDELRAFTGDASSATGGSLTLGLDVALNVYAAMTQASSMRATRATVITTSGGNQMRFPREATTGAATQVAGQTTAFAGTDPSFGVMTLDAFDCGQLIDIGNDMLEDTGIDLLSWMTRKAGTLVGKLSDQWYVTGNGSTQPQGIVTAGGTGAAGTGVTGGSLIYGPAGAVANKLNDFVFSVDSGYRQRGEWLLNDVTANAFRDLRSDSGGTSGRWLYEMSPTAGLSGGVPDMLLGYPVHIDSNVASLASASSIAVFGDFSAFYIRDVRSFQLSRSDDRKFDTNASEFRALLRTDSDLIDKTAVNILRAVVA